MSHSPSAVPRLTWFEESWRLGVTAVLGASLWVAQFTEEPGSEDLKPLLDLLVGVVCLVLVHQRRRWPLVVGLACMVGTSVSAFGVGPALLALVSVASSRGWRPAAVLVGAGVAAGIPYAVLYPDLPTQTYQWWLLVGISLLVYGSAAAIGLYIGARRELVRSALERAATAEREQATRLETARANERQAIAREMHDVLAHRISLIAMHAGAMSYRDDLSRDELKDSARVVQESAHQALVDLREVLGVLRNSATADEDGPPAPDPPQPTLVDLPQLVEESAAAGTPVVLQASEVDLGAVPDLLGRTAYRIVQEGLTNARKHAPGAPVVVRVHGRRGRELVVEVRNRLVARSVAAPGVERTGAGMGLIGLGERATLSGGRLQHGETSGGEFVLTARLPWLK